MALWKRTDQDREDDANYIAELFVKNLSVREITRQLNERNAKAGKGYAISFQQVHQDIKKILAEWKEERTEFVDDRINIELQKLDRIEKECWDGWELSKSGKMKTKIDGGAKLPDGSITGGTVLERILETGYGDVRFLDRIQSCIERRVELLGVAAPKKIELIDSPANNQAVNQKQEEVISELRRLSKVLNLPELLKGDGNAD